MSSSPAYLDPVVVPLLRGETVLDVGCGYGRWGFLARTNYWEAGMDAPPLVDGLDAFEENVRALTTTNLYRNVWQQTMPSELVGQWDTVLACELLEHLAPEDVEPTLRELEKAARLRVVISTPNYEDIRPGSDTAHGFNSHEAHHSYIPRSTLRKRGYRIHGAGFRLPGRLLGTLSMRVKFVRSLASISLYAPVLAAGYVAYRDSP